MLAPESTTNSLSSDFIVDAVSKIHFLSSEWNVDLFLFFELKDILDKFPGRIALDFRTLPEI